MKTFLITVDTEGDNLWEWKPGDRITTENTLYIPRFQALCEKYGFKPVYLTNYEMAMDENWVRYSAQKAREGKCEIGMHLHAWNTPPEYSLKKNFGGNPYITEYPKDVIEEKVFAMVDLLRKRYEMEIVSHRSGRWATNDIYFDILARNGIRVDCSVTPEIDWSGNAGYSQKGGNDYRKAVKGVSWIQQDILEVPMTTRRVRRCGNGSAKHRVKTLLLGEEMWLRPICKSLEPMKELTSRVIQEGNGEYLEFMIHSSELMPGGSIYFKTAVEVEKLYEIMEAYFLYVSEFGYRGETLRDFAARKGGII